MSVVILYYNGFEIKNNIAEKELTQYIKDGYTIKGIVMSSEKENIHYYTLVKF